MCGGVGEGRGVGSVTGKHGLGVERKMSVTPKCSETRYQYAD